MARFTVEIPDDLDKELRIHIIEVFGSEKGALTKAIVEAIKLWLRQREPSAKKR